jgi:hypothetical protein
MRFVLRLALARSGCASSLNPSDGYYYLRRLVMATSGHGFSRSTVGATAEALRKETYAPRVKMMRWTAPHKASRCRRVDPKGVPATPEHYSPIFRAITRAHDVARSATDHRKERVPQVSLDWELDHQAVAAEYVQRLPADVVAAVGGRGILGDRQPAVRLSSSVVGEETSLLQRRKHIDQLKLHGLKRRDRVAELFALFAIGVSQ